MINAVHMIKAKKGGGPAGGRYKSKDNNPKVKQHQIISTKHEHYRVEGEENSSPSSSFRFFEESVDPTGPSKSSRSRKKSSESAISISPLTPGEAAGEEKASAAQRTEVGLGTGRGEAVGEGSGSTSVGSGAAEGPRTGSE